MVHSNPKIRKIQALKGKTAERQDYNQLTVVSFAAVVWSRDTTPSISRLRESTSRDETK